MEMQAEREAARFDVMDITLSPDSPALVIGAANIDVIGVLDDTLHTSSSNPAHIRFTYGGVARNVAENLARLGSPVQLITAIGDDQFGTQLKQQAIRAGIDVEAVLCAKTCSTGSYLGVVNTAGEAQLALDDMHVLKILTPEYLRNQYALFKQASLLFLDANLSKATLRTAMSLAKRAKIPVFADPTAGLLAHRFLPYLDRIHLITPNVAEAEILSGQKIDPRIPEQAQEAAKSLVSKGIQIAILTLGEFGVAYATSETAGYIPAIHTEIIDPTGGGDALTAAVVFALLNDIPLDDAIRLGVSAASLTLKHRGAVLPDLSLEKLYDHLVI